MCKIYGHLFITGADDCSFFAMATLFLPRVYFSITIMGYGTIYVKFVYLFHFVQKQIQRKIKEKLSNYVSLHEPTIVLCEEISSVTS